MFLTQSKRIIKAGVLNSMRNPFLSFSSIFIITITLFVIGISLLGDRVLSDVLDTSRNKVDTTVYFVQGTPEPQIFEFKTKLETLSKVKSVAYVSQEEALVEYRKRHENDLRLLEGLDILGENPLRARLSIKVFDAVDFESIANFLQNEDILSDNPRTIIDKIDYYQNRVVIERLTSIINTISILSNALISLFAFISFLIIYNTIRLVIFTSKEEISVMHLIGAGSLHIKGPFIISGLIYGVISSIVATALLYPFVVWASSISSVFFSETESLVSYYISNLWFILLVLIALGGVLGAISSWVAVRRYIK